VAAARPEVAVEQRGRLSGRPSIRDDVVEGERTVHEGALVERGEGLGDADDDRSCLVDVHRSGALNAGRQGLPLHVLVSEDFAVTGSPRVKEAGDARPFEAVRQARGDEETLNPAPAR